MRVSGFPHVRGVYRCLSWLSLPSRPRWQVSAPLFSEAADLVRSFERGSKSMKTNLSPKRVILIAAVFALVAFGIISRSTVTAAGGFHGAIYDTDHTSVPVDLNIHTSKDDVYLNGGPQNANANGLPFETFYFQVTDPSGHTLLSTDPAVCRQVIVGAGLNGN